MSGARSSTTPGDRADVGHRTHLFGREARVPPQRFGVRITAGRGGETSQGALRWASGNTPDECACHTFGRQGARPALGFAALEVFLPLFVVALRCVMGCGETPSQNAFNVFAGKGFVLFRGSGRWLPGCGGAGAGA